MAAFILSTISILSIAWLAYQWHQTMTLQLRDWQRQLVTLQRQFEDFKTRFQLEGFANHTMFEKVLTDTASGQDLISRLFSHTTLDKETAGTLLWLYHNDPHAFRHLQDLSFKIRNLIPFSTVTVRGNGNGKTTVHFWAPGMDVEGSIFWKGHDYLKVVVHDSDPPEAEKPESEEKA